MIQKVNGDQAVVFWESHKCPRADVHSAFDAEGLGGLLPKVDKFAALKATAVHLVDQYGVRAGGRVEYNGLGNACGIEVRRFIRGEKMNDLPFLFSIGVVEDELDPSIHTVEVLKVDSICCSEIASDEAKVNLQATQHWRSQLDFITANDLTNAIAAMVKQLHGTMLRKSGVVWHMPEDGVDVYERIATALRKHDVQMHSLRFDPVVNDALIKHVVSTIEDQYTSMFGEMINEANDLRTRGGKPRQNGQQTRLDTLIEADSHLQAHKGLIGKLFVKLSKLGQAAKQAIGAEAINVFR